MSRPGFYNDNANRYFPFLKGEGDGFIPKNVIVDAGFVMGPKSGYVAGTHSVWLGGIIVANSLCLELLTYEQLAALSSAQLAALLNACPSVDGGTCYFYFRSDAPGLNGSPIIFARDFADPAYVHEYADDDMTVGSISESESVACGAPLWSGYLVTGDMDGIINGSGSAVVEPANVRSLVQQYAHSLNIANGDRTRFSVPDGCNPQCHTVPPQDVWVRQACMQGSIRFKEGYNLAIRQDANRNALIFDAVVAGGDGEPCEQVPVYASETVPRHATTYDGAVSCADVFRSINGLGGPAINILAGAGVRIEADPDNHKLVVNVDMNSLVICAGESEDFEYTSLSPSDECDCGEV